MKRFAIAVALVATLSFVGSAQALGPAPAGTAIAQIDGVTGEVVVSVNGVTNWYIESLSGALTGASPAPPLPLSAGGLATDNDSQIGETNLAQFSYTDVNLGVVVNPGSQNDFMIHWTGELGSPEGWAPVQFVPEPASLALAGMGLCGVLATRRRRVS